MLPSEHIGSLTMGTQPFSYTVSELSPLLVSGHLCTCAIVTFGKKSTSQIHHNTDSMPLTGLQALLPVCGAESASCHSVEQGPLQYKEVFEREHRTSFRAGLGWVLGSYATLG